MSFSTRLLFFALVTLPAMAFAQVTPSETQSRYNNEGVLKMQENDYEGAVARFQSSLALGDLNITYLNLGRSYFRLDRCLEAREAFEAVESAPAVASPTPAEIAAALEKFRTDLDDDCTGTVVFACDAPTKVALNGAKARVCEGELAWPVKAGTHVARRLDGDAKETVAVGAGETVTVTLQGPTRVAEPDGADESTGTDNEVAVTVESGSAGTPAKDIFGWFAVGSGGVMLITALLVDQTIVSSSLDDVNEAAGQDEASYNAARDTLESQQTLNRIVVASGVGLSIVGVALLLWPDPEDPESVELTPVISQDGAAVQARWRW